MTVEIREPVAGHPAPVVVFAFARPDHLRRTLEALLLNPEASASALYIFCDGPRRPEHGTQVDAVRRVAESVEGFASVTRVYRETNLGLASSVISGVSEVIEREGRAIIVEDDLLVSPHFLKYMNDGLALYADDEKVASIHAYMYPVGRPLPDTFFLRGADCWGWATWKRAWQHFNSDGKELLRQIKAQGLTKAFDLDSSYPYTAMLADQIAGRNDSWAVRWHASCFLKGMLTLYPGKSLVANIGNDGSGTHAGQSQEFDVARATAPVVVQRVVLVESEMARHAVVAYFRGTRHRRGALMNFVYKILKWVVGRVNRSTTKEKGILKTAAETLFQWEARLAARWASSAHRRLRLAQWTLLPRPEHFDHHIDLFHQWLNSRNPMWLERGILSQLALRGGEVLELSCGDGFYTRNFYSLKSSHIIGCDIDPQAIETARKKNSAHNIEYFVADLRHEIPKCTVQNVIWDFAFPFASYFSLQEMVKIIEEIKIRLTGDGVFSGYTMSVEILADCERQPHQFSSPAELQSFLMGYFKHAKVIETTDFDRKNLYFWASDQNIPIGI